MRQKIEQTWRALAIRYKIILFTGGVLLIILLSCILDVWVVRFSMADFYQILEENSQNGEVIRAIEAETTAFERYIKNPDDEKRLVLENAMRETKKAVEQLPSDYRRLGDSICAQIWSIQNCYEVYQEQRGQVLAMDENSATYIAELYEVYEIQEYLLSYARTLMLESVEAGNAVYKEKYSWMIIVPAVAIILIMFFFSGVLWLAKMMNHSIIHPVIELAEASRKIAANEFFIEDVCADNQDEIGELVAAFNKMKYATGRYIQTQEENRIALGKLHEKELERYEMERRLESAKMELLISQINPHFLFNTLNVIGGMANLEEAEITEKMIKALSDLFRYNLKNDEPQAPLASELKVMQDYMYLQHMRFGARISYQLDCRVDSEKILIPAFTFQPLVENAIIHGLTPKVEGGKIKIQIRKKKGILLIIVADNGIGISRDTQKRLRETMMQGSRKETGIGFANVSRRIYAMYPGTKIEIFSRENRGTIVKIQIPMEGD